MPLLADVVHHRHQVLREGIGIAGDGLVERLLRPVQPV